jgi:hypothetical protein
VQSLGGPGAPGSPPPARARLAQLPGPFGTRCGPALTPRPGPEPGGRPQRLRERLGASRGALPPKVMAPTTTPETASAGPAGHLCLVRAIARSIVPVPRSPFVPYPLCRRPLRGSPPGRSGRPFRGRRSRPEDSIGSHLEASNPGGEKMPRCPSKPGVGTRVQHPRPPLSAPPPGLPADGFITGFSLTLQGYTTKGWLPVPPISGPPCQRLPFPQAVNEGGLTIGSPGSTAGGTRVA